MCPIPLYPTSVLTCAHCLWLPTTLCTPYPLYPIAHGAHTPKYPIAHVPHTPVPHCPCDSIVHGAHTPCPIAHVPHTHVPHFPCDPYFYPLKHVPHTSIYPIAHMIHTPATPLPMCPILLYTIARKHHCQMGPILAFVITIMPMCPIAKMCSIPLHPIAHMSHCLWDPYPLSAPYPLYPIAHVLHMTGYPIAHECPIPLYPRLPMCPIDLWVLHHPLCPIGFMKAPYPVIEAWIPCDHATCDPLAPCAPIPTVPQCPWGWSIFPVHPFAHNANQLPLYPIAHVPIPLYPIAHVPHTSPVCHCPCVPLSMGHSYPLCPIAHVAYITTLYPITPEMLLPHWQHVSLWPQCAPYPCTLLPSCSRNVPMCPITPIPIGQWAYHVDLGAMGSLRCALWATIGHPMGAHWVNGYNYIFLPMGWQGLWGTSAMGTWAMLDTFWAVFLQGVWAHG